jgi:hypothetical protein
VRSDEVLVALVFAVLLVLEWRSRRGILRLAAAWLALAVWLFAQPGIHRAVRRALELPPTERVVRWRDGEPPVSEYVSGVLTLEKLAAEDANADFKVRMMSLGTLFWLACSPAFRGKGPNWKRAFSRRTPWDGERG